MHSILKLSFLALLFTRAIADIPHKDGYKIHWADDFDGESVDTKEWHHEINEGHHNNGEIQEYIKSESTASLTGKGSLKITPQKSRDGK